MKPERVAGLAFIVGSLGMLVTVAGHPHGGGQQSHALEWSNPAVVLISELSLATLLFGFVRLARLGSPQQAWIDASLVAFAFAAGAGALAPLLNHAVTPGLVAHAGEHGVMEQAGGAVFAVVVANNSLLNKTLFQVTLGACAAAMLFVSAALVKNRGGAKALGAAGLVLGMLTVAALLAGRIDNSLHDMTVALLGLGSWLIALGACLCMDRLGLGDRGLPVQP